MFVVILADTDALTAWGPFTDRARAERFARFVSREIDPAGVVVLRSANEELLNYLDTLVGAHEAARRA